VSGQSQPPGRDSAIPLTLAASRADVGLVTRAVSWAMDLLLINLVAIITGLGAELVTSMFPITKNLKPLFVAIAGVVYVTWAAAYFVVFWSISGQTPGARVMQVRLVTVGGGKVRPGRALVRWIGMNLAMVPLPWGFVPIPFRRLGFPDWLAHTRVIEAPGLSIAEARRGRMRGTRSRPPLAAPPPGMTITDDR
jgi:uncharacterized RDD family membrane protein YckC